MDLQGSPEMKYARSRLGNLLQGIRENTTAGVDLEGAETIFGELDDDYRQSEEYSSSRKSPGRKRGRKERKVLFELRGKPFELRDNLREESLFALCRTWVQGREFYPSTTGVTEDLPAPPPIAPLEPEPLEVTASKEIYQLPKPDSDIPMVVRSATNRPPLDTESSVNVMEDTESRQAILQSYLPRWKAVKRSAIKESQSREARYESSLNLLRAVHAIHAHNTLAVAAAAAV